MNIGMDTDRSRFMSFVEKTPTCWIWAGARTIRGYGRFRFLGENWLASRAAWHLLRGPIPDGFCILHRCDNPPCVNPDHLFLGTRADNAADKAAKGRAPRGINAPRAILKTKQVRLIKSMKGRVTGVSLARELGVSNQCVYQIWRGNTYVHD